MGYNLIKELQEYATETKAQSIVQAYRAYKESCMYTLWDAYGTPSRHKERIWEEWQNKLNATKVTGRNSSTFSIGGLFDKDGITYFAYITKSNNRICPLDWVKEVA